jgi:hypothetical protein
MVVDVQSEAGLLDVKGERTVDVGDRQRDDLQGEHHGSPACAQLFMRSRVTRGCVSPSRSVTTTTKQARALRADFWKDAEEMLK